MPLVKKLPTFMEAKGSLTFSQEPMTCTNPEPD